MGNDSCSILKGKAGVHFCVGQDMHPAKTAVIGSGYGETHVSVNIVVHLGGWEFPIGFQTTGNLFQDNVCFIPKDLIY